jgi:SAM-dependent methyltransferase
VTNVSPRWEDARTVAGFVAGRPNETLVGVARQQRDRGADRCLDIGCGAARNAVPLAELGYRVFGVDLAAPMLAAARRRASASSAADRLHLVRAPMTPLPFADRTFDLVVAHGIWNLARSGDEFRRAVAEGARVARPGATLFLFTFSRQTLPDDAEADPGESFVFSRWNGEPQCFLTARQLTTELAAAGFQPSSAVPLHELNRPGPGEVHLGGPPVIYEGTFVRQ